MIINHNLSAINAHRQMGINNSSLSKSLEKLSSGLGINRAADNAAGLAISEKMRGQISGLNQANSNAQDGISLAQTAEGALNETQSILQRMRELSVQSANGTYQDDVDRKNIQTEIKALKTEVDRISTSTHYNGIKLLDGTSSAGKVTYGEITGATTAQPVEYNNISASLGTAPTTATINISDQEKFTAAFGDASGKVSEILVDTTRNAGAGTITLKKADGTVVASLTGLDTTGPIAAGSLTGANKAALDAVGIDSAAFATAADVGGDATDISTSVTEKSTAATITAGAAGTFTEATGCELLIDGNTSLKNGDYTITYNHESQYVSIADKATGEVIDKAKIGDVVNAGDQINFDKIGAKLLINTQVTNTGTTAALSDSADLTMYSASTGRNAITGASGADSVSDYTFAAVGGQNLSIDFGATDALNGYTIKFMGNSEDGVAAEVDNDAKTITIKLDTGTSATEKAKNSGKAIQDALKAQATSLGVKADDIKVTGNGSEWVDGTGVLASAITETLTVGLGIEEGAKSVTTNELSTTVDFSASELKAGSTVTVGDKTYELVENGKTATNADATAISISDFDDKEAVVKAIADKVSLQPDVTVTADKNVMTIQNTATDATEAVAVELDEMGGITLQIGANGVKDQRVTLSVQDQSAEGLGIQGIDCSTQEGANAAIDVIDDAINSVSGTRADLGALQNRLEHTINSLGVASENLTAAESRIRDVDMAKEMMNFTKTQILSQASQAMLAQANQLPQGVLQLLQ
jgi:flagellin